MSRNVTQVRTFTHNPKFGMEKEKTVIRCDDGSVYEFEDSDSVPKTEPPRLVRAFQPDGRMTHIDTREVLPDAVKETCNSLFGGWSK